MKARATVIATVSSMIGAVEGCPSILTIWSLALVELIFGWLDGLQRDKGRARRKDPAGPYKVLKGLKAVSHLFPGQGGSQEGPGRSRGQEEARLPPKKPKTFLGNL